MKLQGLRFDFDYQLVNDDDEPLCSMCYDPIDDDQVPLLIWLKDARWMATVCDNCLEDVFKLTPFINTADVGVNEFQKTHVEVGE